MRVPRCRLLQQELRWQPQSAYLSECSAQLDISAYSAAIPCCHITSHRAECGTLSVIEVVRVCICGIRVCAQRGYGQRGRQHYTLGAQSLRLLLLSTAVSCKPYIVYWISVTTLQTA